MRIAFLVTSFPNPSSTPILKQVVGLMDRGHEVDIYGDRQGNLSTIHADIERYGILKRVYNPIMPKSRAGRFLKGASTLASRVWGDPKTCFRAMNVLRFGEMAYGFTLLYAAQPFDRKKHYDIVHCQFAPNGIKGLFLKECGIVDGPLLTTIRGYDVTSYPRRRGADVYAELFRKGDYFTANSDFLAHKAIDLGCPPEKIVTLPTGINMSRFQYVERPTGADREITVLSVGSLVEVKGIGYGLRAMAEVMQRFPRVQYNIAGDGPLRSSLEGLADELGIADRVQFLGAQTEDQLVAQYAQADLFLFPGVVSSQGDEEGFGGVCVEAQASGLPVVASRVGGIPQTVKENESGFLVEQKNVSALVDALCNMLEHPQRWSEMGKAGRSHVVKHFDLDLVTDRLVEIYERLLRDSLPNS